MTTIQVQKYLTQLLAFIASEVGNITNNQFVLVSKKNEANLLHSSNWTVPKIVGKFLSEWYVAKRQDYGQKAVLYDIVPCQQEYISCHTHI